MSAANQSTPTDYFLILLGVASAAFGLESFLLPNDFIDGGVTGVSLLLVQLTGLPLSLLLFLVNLPFLWLAQVVIGKRFARKTVLAITLLSLAIFFIHWPEVTEDKLLVSVFGGFFLGTGIGLSMRGGAVLDGTEILAIFLSRRLRTKVSDWIIIINLIIFSVAAYVLSVEQALYSLLTYFVASKALDFIVDGVEEYQGVTIVSQDSEAVRRALLTRMHTGVTILRGRGGFPDASATLPDRDVLYVVITRLEIRKLYGILEEVDPAAFVTMTSLRDIRGGLVKQRRGSH